MRERIEAYLNGSSNTPPVVVLAERLSARIGGMSFQDMQQDAAHWVGNQGKLRRLLNVDGVIIGADPTLAAEALGQSPIWSDDQPRLPADGAANVTPMIPGGAGRQQQAIEAITRLCKTDRAETGCIAMMTGPATLAKQLYGGGEEHLGEVKAQSVELAEQLCQARPDLLLLREGAALNQVGMPQRKAFNTLKNMAAYFDVPLGLYLEDYSPDILQDLDKLKLPFLWLGADTSGAVPTPETVRSLAHEFTGIGVPLDFANPAQAREQAVQYRAALSDCNYLLTSCGELPRDSDLEVLITLTRELSTCK